MKDRLIELIQNSVNGCARHWAEIIADYLIKNDVVPVVRCRECKHFKTNINKENYCDIHSTRWDKFYVNENEYCSRGEKR